MTLTPAYGRDYKSKKDVLIAFNADKDFVVNDMFSSFDGKMCNRADLLRDSVSSVTIRYNGMKSVAVVTLK